MTDNISLNPSLRGAKRRGNLSVVRVKDYCAQRTMTVEGVLDEDYPPCIWKTPYNRHCEERSDAAIQHRLAPEEFPLLNGYILELACDGLPRYARNDGGGSAIKLLLSLVQMAQCNYRFPRFSQITHKVICEGDNKNRRYYRTLPFPIISFMTRDKVYCATAILKPTKLRADFDE